MYMYMLDEGISELCSVEEVQVNNNDIPLCLVDVASSEVCVRRNSVYC